MPDELNSFLNEAATQSVNADSPTKCPYCQAMFNSWGAWYKDHMRDCRKGWIKRRGMERKKAGRAPLTGPEKAKLIEQEVFKGFKDD